MANFPKSQPIHFLFNFSATANVVPLPQKKSATKSFSLVEESIILSNKFSGFCVGYLRFSIAPPCIAEISVHKSLIFTPLFSSKYCFFTGIEFGEF